MNVGGTGTVTAGGETYTLPNGACLYVGRGTRDVVFANAADDQDDPGAQFYLFSAPAHTTYPTQLVLKGQGNALELGDQLTSNRRTLNQYIHPNGIRSCQIMMGVTELHPGSMWNTMPAHTHDRRTECYLYFDVPEDARVIHLLGEPTETRHLVVGRPAGGHLAVLVDPLRRRHRRLLVRVGDGRGEPVVRRHGRRARGHPAVMCGAWRRSL